MKPDPRFRTVVTRNTGKTVCRPVNLGSRMRADRRRSPPPGADLPRDVKTHDQGTKNFKVEHGNFSCNGGTARIQFASSPHICRVPNGSKPNIWRRTVGL